MIGPPKYFRCLCLWLDRASRAGAACAAALLVQGEERSLALRKAGVDWGWLLCLLSWLQALEQWALLDDWSVDARWSDLLVGCSELVENLLQGALAALALLVADRSRGVADGGGAARLGCASSLVSLDEVVVCSVGGCHCDCRWLISGLILSDVRLVMCGVVALMLCSVWL